MFCAIFRTIKHFSIKQFFLFEEIFVFRHTVQYILETIQLNLNKFRIVLNFYSLLIKSKKSFSNL